MSAVWTTSVRFVCTVTSTYMPKTTVPMICRRDCLIASLSIPILGCPAFRCDASGPVSFAYVTDMTRIAPDSLHGLEGLDCLVVNALRFEPHPTHQSLAEALALVKLLSPRSAYFTHMSHGIGLHAETERLLPSNVHLGYDGLTIEV